MEKEELTKVSVWETGNGNDFWFTGGPPIGIPLAAEAALREALNAREEVRRQQEAALPMYRIKGIPGAEPPFISLFTFNRDGAARFEWGAFGLYATENDALEAAGAEMARLKARDRQRAGLPPKEVTEVFRDVG